MRGTSTSRRALLTALMGAPLAGAGALAWARAALAEPLDGAVSDAPERVQVTVYRGGEMDGLAQITETRTVDIGAGVQRVSFRGVSDGLVPQTVAVEGLPGRLKERNEDYDLISPGSVLAKSVGEDVTVVRTNPKTGKASETRGVLRAAPNGMVVDFGDHVEALQCSGLPERLVFDRAPPGLSARPTLSVQLTGARPGRYRVILSYLASGISWETHYVARLNPGGKTLDLTGWLTIKNEGAVGFEGAGTSVVAGDLNMTGETVPPEVSVVDRYQACWPMGTTHRGRPPPPPPPPPAPAPMYMSGGADEVSEVVVTGSRRQESLQDVPIAVSAYEETLGDYRLYRLPVPTTVAAHQAKQVMLLSRPGVKCETVFTFRTSAWEASDDEAGQPAKLLLRLDHRRGGPLDVGLPRGDITLVEPLAVGPLLAGEGTMRDSPVGPPVEIEMGDTETVRVRTRVVKDTTPKKDVRRQDLEVTLTNLRAEPVLFELRQDASDEGFKLLSASRKAGLLHGDPMWRLTLPPGKPVTLRYSIQTAD